MTVIGQSRKKKEFIAASGYKDIIVADTIIWALDVNGTLKSFSSTGNELTLDISIKSPITSIHKTNGDTLIFICDRNVIVFNTKTLKHNISDAR
jgi:hypothetical protein